MDTVHFIDTRGSSGWRLVVARRLPHLAQALPVTWSLEERG